MFCVTASLYVKVSSLVWDWLILLCSLLCNFTSILINVVDVGDDVMDAGVSLSGLRVPIWPINWQNRDKNVLT